MSSPALNITTITANDAQQALQNDGLDTLGLTTLALSTRWADTTPAVSDYNSTNLTLHIGALHAPYRGILEFAFSPVKTTLAADITVAATSLTVKSGDGANFPSPTGGTILLTLTSPSSTKTEVVECTARTGDTFTITRGAADSSAQAFSTGDAVTLRMSSGARTSDFIGADGNPLTDSCAVYRMHPAAVWRLETLMQDRYSTGTNPVILPIPWVMVVRGAQGFKSARWFEPDEAITGINGDVSFHDGRGLIVDPVYVAALFADLQAWLVGLTGKTSTAPANGAGGVQSIAGLVTGTLVHVVDLHGNVFQPAAPAVPAPALVTKNGGGTQTGTVPASGLVTLAAGDGIDSAGTDNGRLRWGWATNGVLARTKLIPPALPGGGMPPAALGRQFYRLAVVDTTWALLGNRTASAVLGIPADDQTIPSDVLPTVRDQVIINYLTDGPDTLGQAATVLARPSPQIILAVSAAIDGSMAVPAQPGANAHWPAFPAPNTNQAFPSPLVSAKQGITAAWTAGTDVVVTIPADNVPAGAHIRIYPQQFVTIPAITQEPSFLRGDGGAGIAVAATVTNIFLPNPFALAGGQPKPNPASLTMDIVVMPRNGARKMWGAVNVTVQAGPAAAPPDAFPGPNAVNAMLPQTQSIAPDPLFGIPTTVTPPGGAPGNVIAFVRALASEGVPRQGPRLPTMARFETVMVTGTSGGTPAGTLNWEAVLSGGRWARETRSALHASGNPGNPAAHDLHAPGIHVTGALAYDLARHAARRTQPIIPLPGSPGTQPGWVIGMAGNNFNTPQDNTTTNTGCGVLLETVAAVCETPELSVVTPPAPGTNTQNVINSIASSIGVTAPTFTAGNDVRVIGEIRREVIVSKSGLRDALWSLRRALREARELIYIESPEFARTARPSGAPTAEQVDLVAEIVTSLNAHPNLKVIVCTPREADFAANYPGWSREHYKARAEAVGNLLSTAPDRVAVFHPIGFPGRTAFIRTTSVIVDDVWALVGATHFRRRGMTFDGSAAVASFDRQMDNGYSKNVRAYRRNIMAASMAIPSLGAGSPTADWLRLGKPESSFELVSDWLGEGGLGAIQPLWPGPSDTTVLPATDDMADPDGSDGSTFLGLLGSLIAESGH
jgi:hypothetical protein